MQVTHTLKRARQVAGHKPATICGPRTRTWLEVYDRVTRLAAALRSLGAKPGDRIAILALNSDCYIESLYAIWWCGGVAVPLNYRFSHSEIVDVLNSCEAKLLVVDDALQSTVEMLQEDHSTIEHVIHAGGSPALEDAHRYENLIAGFGPMQEVERASEDLAAILYTSGTTGKPRGVMLTHSNLDANYFNIISQDWVDENSVYLHVAPMFHSADGMFIGGVTLVGGTHVVVPAFDVAEVLKAISAHRVTGVLLVPTMLRRLLDGIHSGDYVCDLSSLEAVCYGASPMPVPLIECAIKTLPSVRFMQGYGMTELAPLASVLEPQFHALTGPLSSKLRSAGRAAYIAEIKISDLEDQEVPCGTIGEILVRGQGMMKGYWKEPELTAQALRGGWMHTGDLGYMDDEGFIFVVDRLKDMIISGGENVYPSEIEAVINQLPEIAMCAVIGVPNEVLGEQVHAIAVPKAGCEISEAKIIDHCRSQIARYKCPRSVEIRQEQLPMNAAGKILKRQLRSSG
jgi:long-chain acyl-CoA synthetase